MVFSNLWARVTGKDQRKAAPVQQAESLGRVGDFVVVSPYGLYADLPADTLLTELGEGRVLSVTVTRPSDTEQGEPVFFHPGTNTRIIARNNGDLDIHAADVNVTAVNANITASDSMTCDTPTTTFTGNVQIDGALNVTGDIVGAANVIAALLVQGATLTISGAGSIEGKDFLTHGHTQSNDSAGDGQAPIAGVTP